MSAEVEEMLKRFSAFKNVQGIIVVDNDGIPIKTTMEYTTTVHYAALMQTLAEKARQVVLDLDAANEFVLIRMRTLKSEIIVAPSDDYFIVVIQDPCD
ncbi:dynein light chain roadblock-type 1 [Scaptodrosophila lebanonensis]|uniref:Dynein light chain roadblock n=1 Tax=Drosophila lebanonensis TaxID=7225 RepID=A0A6J2U7Q7_DROLE|nr:dynein light chain roadblock-type 1 [Scaptodrosophila lebanonensis]